jgi:hypothetical protein
MPVNEIELSFFACMVQQFGERTYRDPTYKAEFNKLSSEGATISTQQKIKFTLFTIAFIAKVYALIRNTPSASLPTTA